jgi:predicted ATPase
MITEFQIKNFRSIKDQTIPVKKLNILYGQNGSGKSSVLYAPYVMRNFFVNPNQKLNSLFNLGFINLGNIENIKGSSADSVITSIKSDIGINPGEYIKYSLSLEDDSFIGSEILYEIGNFSQLLQIDIPFTTPEKIEVEIYGAKFLWNGLTFESTGRLSSARKVYPYELNIIYSDIKAMEMVSVRRGFFSPIFSSEFNPDEASFALQIREALDFELKIDKYFHSIFDKNFRFVAIPGSTSFYLRTHTKSGRATDLVNEGFGVNQTIYMLVKLLKKNTGLALIEEPEIHLHPTAQSKLMDAFCDIVQKENKQIFLTTHSENIVSSVLRKIADGEISKDDVQFYLAKKENDETVILPQQVNDKGQLEGGLMNFMETELNNLKTILGI